MKIKAYAFNSHQEKEELVKKFGEEYFRFVPISAVLEAGFMFSKKDYQNASAEARRELGWWNIYFTDEQLPYVEIVPFEETLPKISLDKKYRTRDGKNVTMLGIFPNVGLEYPVVGVLEGANYLNCWSLSGNFYDDQDSQYDLIEVVDVISFDSSEGSYTTIDVNRTGEVYISTPEEDVSISIDDAKKIVETFESLQS